MQATACIQIFRFVNVWMPGLPLKLSCTAGWKAL